MCINVIVHLCLCSILSREKNVWIFVQQAAHPSVFADWMRGRLGRDSLCVPHRAHVETRGLCILWFIYTAAIWRVGGKNGWRGRTRQVGELRRGDRKMQTRGLMESGENVQIKRTYCKHAEPLVPQLCSWQSRLKPFHFLFLILLRFSGSELKHYLLDKHSCLCTLEAFFH